MKPGVYFDIVLGRLRRTLTQFIEDSDVASIAAAFKIPIAGATGKLDVSWLPPQPVLVTESDGAPTVEATQLIFDSATVTDIGNGVVRVSNSGGSNFIAGGLLRANQAPLPAPDGQRLVFTLPSTALSGSVSVYEKLAGESSYRLVGPDRVTTASLSIDVSLLATSVLTSNNLLYGWGSSGNPASWFDHSTSTGCGFNAYGVEIDAPVWVLLDFGSTSRDIAGGSITGQTAGGWSPPNHHRWEYSDDAITWSTALAGVASALGDVKTSFSWPSVGPHRYWRLYVLDNHINGGGYSTCIRDIEFIEAPSPYITAITFTSAPLATTAILTSYQEPA
jgi:hypothetical protein